MSCVIHEGRYCPGCLVRYDRRFYGEVYDDEDLDDYTLSILEQEHEAQCRPYQAHRVQESLKFFARLDSERAAGSW